jgi:hypothetical protein
MANHRPAITIETRYAERGGQYGFPDNTALHADLGSAMERILPDVTIVHRGLMPQLPDSMHLIEVRQLIVCVGTAVPIPQVVKTLQQWLRRLVTPRYGSDDHLSGEIAAIDHRVEELRREESGLIRLGAKLDEGDDALESVLTELREVKARRRVLEGTRERLRSELEDEALRVGRMEATIAAVEEASSVPTLDYSEGGRRCPPSGFGGCLSELARVTLSLGDERLRTEGR